MANKANPKRRQPSYHEQKLVKSVAKVALVMWVGGFLLMILAVAFSN